MRLSPFLLPASLAATLSTVQAAPPAAPSGLTATAPYVSTVRLNWVDNSDNESGFELAYRAGTSGAFVSLGTTSANTTTVTLTGTSPATTYQFQIRAFLNPGPENSAYTDPVTVTTPGFSLPPAPIGPAVGAAPADRTLTLGIPAVPLSLAGLFTDPDVSSAARLITDLGNVDFVLYPSSAPETAANFLSYLNRGDFINTIFHRSVPGFIIQGGAFRADATASAVTTSPPATNEPLISNVRGTVAMARTNIVNSATNQFFINLADNSDNLDYQNQGFTVFARVAGTGMTVADAIAALPIQNYSTTNNNLTHVPVRISPPPATPTSTAYDPANLVRLSAAAVVPALTIAAVSANPAVVTPALTGDFLSGYSLSLNPLAPGVTTVTLTATDLDHLTASTSFQVTVQDGYQAWAGSQSFALPGDAAPDADPDKDGSSNLLEFALATSPLTATGAALVPGAVDGHLTLTFPLTAETLAGTTVELQSAESPEGGGWTTRWTHTDGLTHPWIASSQPSAGFLSITARDPAPFTGTPRRFLRLKVTRP